jgi:hypothetical protein
MSNNIWGYQGLQTPLENLTQGNYNVADYTNMRREFSARLQALENAGGFTPTNVSIQGYCNIVPGTNGFGNFSATGSTILGGTLNVASTATFQGGVTVAGALSVSSVNISSLSVDAITASGNITSTTGQFIGNGSGLTGVTGTDSTKLPLTGGILTGALTTQNIVVSGGFSISGNGAGLTNINDITKLPLAGGTVSGAMGVGGNLNTNGTFQALGNITAVSPAKFIGDGSSLTNVVATDNTKLPLAGGTMTGNISARIIQFSPGYSAYNYKANRFTSFGNTSPGATYTVTQLNTSVHDYIRLEFNSACTVSLTNLGITTNQYYQDGQRLVTITKRNLFIADYAVTVSPPLGYLFFSKVGTDATSYSIPLGVFSVTFMISNAGGANVVDVISTVTV